MIAYDSRKWLSALALHRADTFRKLLPALVILALVTWGIGHVEVAYLRAAERDYVKNLPAMHGLLGFAISMLLVFRTNTAYDRWWEGRKLWGSLVNVSRNLAVKVVTMTAPDDSATRTLFAELIGRFAAELVRHLRADATAVELDFEPHPEIPELDRAKHVPTQVVRLMLARIQKLTASGALTNEQMIVLTNDVNQFLDICGACERIRNTPIPYSYSSFIKKFIVVYVATLPFGFVITLGYLAIPVVVFVFYVLASLELIAEEIEAPFGTDTNDLPLDRLATQIAANAADTLR